MDKCVNGHDWDEENTYRRSNGYTVCRSCLRDQRRLRKERGIPPGDSRHGTVTGYTAWGCRCADCADAWTIYRAGSKYGAMYDEVRMVRSVYAVVGCLVCGDKTRKTALDHHHETKTFRGILCVNCNQAIGKFGDNAATVRRAIEYLQRPAKLE